MKKVSGTAAGLVFAMVWMAGVGFGLGMTQGNLVPHAWAEDQAGESADEPAPLSDQIKSLSTEISALRAEIEALINAMQVMERRMTMTERELEALRAGGSGTPGDPAGSDPFSTNGGVDSSRERFAELGFPSDQPLASPESAYLEAVKLYREELKDLAYETPRDKINYVRRVRQWAGRTDRSLTGKISWICELQSVETLQDGATIITIQVVNPVDRSDLWSQPQVLEISRRVATSLKRQRSSAGVGASYVKITGIFRLKQVVDDTLEVQVIFEEPYLVGPFVTFDYEIDVKSVANARIQPPAPGHDG